MRHVWLPDMWQNLKIGDVKESFLERAKTSPRLGDISVRDLCCLTNDTWNPIGIYIFTDSNIIKYVGKTHGRSFHERMISHLDHREPIEGSPHMAQLVQSMIKKGYVKDGHTGVDRVLNMRATWLPVPSYKLQKKFHQNLIAIIERRLLWEQCLNPEFNSPRVKKNNFFRSAGEKYFLDKSQIIASVPETLRAAI